MNKVKKITALLLCVLTIFSLFSVTTVGAAETTTAESFSSYGTVHQYHGAGNVKIQYGGWDGTTDTSNATYLYRVDAINGRAIDMSNYTKTTWYNTSDSFAYCLDPGLSASADGTYNIAGYWSNSNNVSKALYYLYGGPGYYDNYGSYTVQTWVIQSLQDIIAANNRDGVSSIDGTGEDFQYAFSHLVISYLNDSSSLDQTDSVGLNWKKEVKWFAENVIPNFDSAPSYFGAYYYNIGASTQRMAGWQVDEVVLQMQKSSSNPELTDNSSCYSLEGAEYQVYYKDASGNAHYVGKITTDANGYGLFENGRKLVKRQYYAKELKAPKGYLLDDSEILFYVYGSTTADGTTVMHFNHAEEPGDDPVAVVLYKEDAITHERVKALAGAEFTVNYYNNYYDAVADLDGITPTRSWIIKTGDNGLARLDEKHFVSGDDFYYKDGVIVLPYGTITIQETKAPDGYQLNEEICLGKITDEGGVGWITGNITTDNNILIEEQPANGYIGVHKVNQDNEPVEGAVYGLYTSDEADSDGMLLESNRVATITTDADGNGTFDYASPVGITAYVQEITAPTGYELDKKVYEATPTVDNIEITNPVVVTVIENAITGNLKIVKTSDDNIVDDVWFKVTDSNGRIYEISTQSNGVAELKNLPVYNKDKSLIKYTVSELGFKQTDGSYKIPARYITPASVTKTLLDNDTVTFEFNNVVIKGNIVVGKTSDDDVVEGIYFRVTAKNGFSVEDKTDSTGYVRFTDLLKYDNFDNKIEYTITELGFKAEDGSYYLPARYKEAKTFTTTVDGAENGWSCHNDVKYGDINIEKKSDDGVVEGLYFEITGSNGYNSVVSTNSEGKASVSKLNVYDDNDNLIQYKVKELGVKNSDGTYSFPERYVPTGEQTRTLTTDKAVTYSFENKIKTANVAIKKISDDGVVANVYFKITNNKGEEIGIFGTNSKGYIGGKINNLPVYDIDNNLIEYTATELGFKNEDGTYEIPYRYKAPKSQTFTLSYDETTTITFNNVLKPGSLTLNKSDENSNPLSGAEFKIYKSDGTEILLSQTGASTYQYNEKGEQLSPVTDSNGKFTVTNLPQGDYYAVETKAPSGKIPYYKEIPFSVVGDNETTINPVLHVKDNNIILFDAGSFGDTGSFVVASVIALFAMILIGAYLFISRKNKGNKEKRKMKKSKKLTSFMAVFLVMILTCFSAGAAETQSRLDTSKKVSFTMNCEKAGYTFNVFKVADLKTAENPYEVTYESLVPEIDSSVLKGDTAEMIKKLDEVTTLPATAKSVGTFTSSSTAKTKTLSNLEQGVYYVRAVNYPAGVKSVTNSAFALPYYNETSGWNYEIPAINLAEKVNDDTPTTHKSITNSTKSNENFTDVSLGDTVNFKIKSTTAGSNQMKLKEYVVSDDMSAGLTLDKNGFSVSLEDQYGKQLAVLSNKDYKVNVLSEGEGKNTVFNVSLSTDYLQNSDFYNAVYTSVTYRATLNKYAVVGFDGNPNTETSLKYTNKNDVSAEIDGNTVYVYTYGVYVDKYNEYGERLSGAEFSLFKTQSDAEAMQNVIATGVSDDNGKVDFYTADGEEIRLQSGQYFIKETKAPEGYNLYTPVIPISIDVSYGDTFVDGTYITGAPEGGYASIEVKNTQAMLPQTGGAGTVIFYILGGISLIGSAILFAVRRKIKQ
ncbi:MAG: SpaH/EbpB family LPXTG-anchored major pilin [Ruminococcus sp.]